MKKCGALIQATVLGDVTCANEKPCKTHGEQMSDSEIKKKLKAMNTEKK